MDVGQAFQPDILACESQLVLFCVSPVLVRLESLTY